MRLFDLNKDGKVSGLEKAVELAWLADSLEWAHSTQECSEDASAPADSHRKVYPQAKSDRTAGILLAIALLAGLVFLASTLGVALVGANALYPIAVISGIVLVLGIVALLVYVRMDA